jgi:hypothetical protein
MTKMVLGYRCGEDVAISPSMAAVAHSRLRHDFAFIGLTEVVSSSSPLPTAPRVLIFWLVLEGVGCVGVLVPPNAWRGGQTCWVCQLQGGENGPSPGKRRPPYISHKRDKHFAQPLQTGKKIGTSNSQSEYDIAVLDGAIDKVPPPTPPHPLHSFYFILVIDVTYHTVHLLFQIDEGTYKVAVAEFRRKMATY